MGMPTLMPRPEQERPVVQTTVETQQYDDDTWREMKPLIQQLYIAEARKLKDVMGIMRARQGFSATPQMYKKRLKKWKIFKRPRKASRVGVSPGVTKAGQDDDAGSEEADGEGQGEGDGVISGSDLSPTVRDMASATSPSVITTQSPLSDPSTQPSSPSQAVVLSDSRTRTTPTQTFTSPFGPQSTITLSACSLNSNPWEDTLRRIQQWSQISLNAAEGAVSDPMSQYVANPDRPPTFDSRTLFRIFELANSLLSRSGLPVSSSPGSNSASNPAGRLAGKAFRMTFEMLDGVIQDHHPDLLWHLSDIAFVAAREGNTPLLDFFLNYIAEMTKLRLGEGHQLAVILCRLRALARKDPAQLQVLLQQAWQCNVHTLEENLDKLAPHQVWILDQLIWDARSPLRVQSKLRSPESSSRAILNSMRQLSSPQTSPTSSSPPEPAVDANTSTRLDTLHLEYVQMEQNDLALSRRLSSDMFSRCHDATSSAAWRVKAYVMKMDARRCQEEGQLTGAVDFMKSAVEMRARAHGDNDVRVIRDMFVLEDLLVRTGMEAEATVWRTEAFARTEEFLRGIPDADTG